MNPIDHLHRLGCPPANAIRVKVAPIAAHHRNHGILGEPGGHAGGGAIGQQVHHAMTYQCLLL